EIKRIGRRPTRSDSIPRIGPTKNCISPQVVAKTTFQSEAAAVSPPASWRIRLGRIGIINPNEIDVISALAKMKPNAARRRGGPDAARSTALEVSLITDPLRAA